MGERFEAIESLISLFKRLNKLRTAARRAWDAYKRQGGLHRLDLLYKKREGIYKELLLRYLKMQDEAEKEGRLRNVLVSDDEGNYFFRPYFDPTQELREAIAAYNLKIDDVNNLIHGWHTNFDRQRGYLFDMARTAKYNEEVLKNYGRGAVAAGVIGGTAYGLNKMIPSRFIDTDKTLKLVDNAMNWDYTGE